LQVGKAKWFVEDHWARRTSFGKYNVHPFSYWTLVGNVGMGLFLIVVMDHLIAYQVPGSFDPCLSMFIQFSGYRLNLWPSNLQH
jgi:hypothetical protein